MKRKYLHKYLVLIALISVTIICYTKTAFALAPPTEEMVEEMIGNGTYQEAVEAAYKLGDNVVSPKLIQRITDTEPSYHAGDGEAAPPQIPPSWQSGMPSIGEGKVLTILVDFPDYPHSNSQTVADMTNMMYGSENTRSSVYPYESLAAYYNRASYGKFNVQGEVWGWYRAPQRSSYYERSDSYDELIASAVNYFIAQGNDITPYDNDGDGVIEAIYFKWTVPEGEWASFWWACATYYGGAEKFQGKEIGRVVWMPYKCKKAANPTGAAVEIHEFGHVLGLPDLYDYDSTAPPSNCMGGLDMMDANAGDHNAFSKYLLGWLEPIIVGTGSGNISLRPTSEYPDAVVVMPSATLNACTEYYIAQYRSATKNDAVYPYTSSDGLVIWHVDATLTSGGYNFKYDNSDSDHPFISLVSRENSQSATGYNSRFEATSTSFYRLSSHTFTPRTIPNSNNWAGNDTGVSITGISRSNNTLTATHSVTSSMAPTLLSSEYDKQANEITLTYDSLLTSGTNLSGIQINGKGIGRVSYTTEIKDNKTILKPYSKLKGNSRYDISIPQNAVKNSNNISCLAEDITIVTEPDSVSQKEGIVLLNTNYDVITPAESVFVTTSGYKPITYLSENMGQAAYDFWIRNNTEENITVQPILAYYINGIATYVKEGDFKTIVPNKTANIWGYIRDLPENYVQTCTVKLFLWNNINGISPLTSAFTLQ